MRIDDISWDSIILEAPNNKKSNEDDLSNNDYEDADMNIEEEPIDEEKESRPKTKKDDKKTEDDGEEDPESEEPEDIELGDPMGDDTDSNSDDDTDTTDETIEDEQNDSGDEQNVDDTQNKYLIRDFIELYNRIDEILNTLIKDKKLNSSINPTYRQIKHNIEKIKDVVYDYIADKFVHETYISNLYQFNLIIQALNINVQMLEINLKRNTEKK